MPGASVLPNLHKPRRTSGDKLGIFLLLAAVFFPACASAQGQAPVPQNPKPQIRAPQPGGVATLSADHQRWVGKIFYGDGNVDVIYENARLHADHVEYDSETEVAMARGHVSLDYMTQHVEADDARYEIRTGKGVFHHVHATFAMQRRAAAAVLASTNPLYFEAEEADRLDDNTYHVHKAWMTVCNPDRPTWKFYAPDATVVLQRSVHLENGNFRLYSVPVLYFPYATFPAEKQRTSGFLIPEPGSSTQKGYVLGDALYWAPLDWMDLTLGGAYYSLRGWSQKGELRMRPWENARLQANYYGVIDRGLEQPDAPPLKQGGHEATLLFTAELPGGWRAVADLDQLTSLTFRLAWFETFSQAVNSEVRNTAFLTKNFNGFSLDFAVLSYENFLSATPASSVTLRTAPEARFSSVDRPLSDKLPFYFSFDAFTGAVHRGDTVTPFSSPNFVERSEIAPSVTLPVHLGPWLDAAANFTFRSTYYGGQMVNGNYAAQSIFRNTEEFSLDMRLPVLERIWQGGDTKWKHTIEPYVDYNYVSGVNDFGRFIRFDEDETLTDTDEVEYGVTQRLFRRTGSGGSQELVTWKIAQKYFFDPTFGGALIPGQRNVFQTLDSLSPFAFADEPRRFSPIVSDLTIEPGKRYDTEFILNYDTQRNRMNVIGTLLKLKPYRESFLTVAQFSTLNMPVNPVAEPPGTCLTVPGVPNTCFQQRSNQLRALAGYGDMNRKGWNATFGASYDFTQGAYQNQIAEFSYNGSCCGIGFEYRKFSFGTIRNENQYMGVFRIANLGSLGNLRRQEKIF
jgi:LPS-assembly protein